MTNATDQESTALVPTVIGPPAPAEWSAIKEQVAEIARSNLVPSSLRGKPADIMVVLLAGREVGIAPIMALNKIHVIEGRPTMSAELMLALVLRAGHEVTILETTNETCRVEARRRGAQRTTEFTYTIGDARNAKLTNKGPWQAHPANMLRARCISNACRAVFPDVLMGASYIPEEMGADVDPFTGDLEGDEAMVGDADVERLMGRISALSETYRAQLRDTCKERGWVVKRLPVRLLADFEAELSGLEAWESMGKPAEPVPDDDEVVEAELLDDGLDDGVEDGAPTPEAEHAEVEREGEATPAPPSTPPAPPAKAKAPKPNLAPTPKQAQAIALGTADVAVEYGLERRDQKDAVRHAFVRWVTDGRVDSTTKMSRDEASRALDLLHQEPQPFVLVITGEADRPLYFEARS